MRKLSDRLKLLSTQNNLDKYKECLSECREIARRDFDNVGWRDETLRYTWEPDPETFSKRMNNLGSHRELSPVPGYDLFMDDDLTEMRFKSTNGEIISFDETETLAVQDSTQSQIQRLLRIKIAMDGTILKESEDDARKKRDAASKKNIGVAKRTGRQLLF